MIISLCGVAGVLFLSLDGPRMSYSTQGRHADFPYDTARIISENTSPVWDIGELPTKMMYREPTLHYQLDSTDADAEWATLFPHNGTVLIGPHKERFLVSMFHQLRCLDVIRRSYKNREGLTPEGPSAAARHCMNYLRQMVLCRRNTRLERVVEPNSTHATQPWSPMTCRDWTRVYHALERNAR